MAYVLLALAALFLFVLGMFCLGKITIPKGTGILGILCGIIGSIMVLYIVFTDGLGAFGPTISFGIGVGAFCFTVLWTLAGFEVVLGGDFKATGWFSLLGGLFAFLLGLGFFNVLGTALPKLPQFGVWLEIWAVAFWTVFAVFALGKVGAMKFLGWWLIIPTVLFTLVYPIIAFTNFGQIAPW
jgi:hypothetical protein